jgi:branched-chain amino acid transport system ATP-binding protein
MSNVTDSDPAISIRALSRHYGGLWALKDVSFDIRRGGVTSLIGPNGAGKTTLFNIVAGMIRPSSGGVEINGKDVTGWPAHRIAQLGVARTFQDLRLFAHLTVLENVIVGTHLRRRAGLLDAIIGSRRQRREFQQADQEARELLSAVGLTSRLNDKPGDLSYGNQRRLEIARALASHPSILMLDEPTSGVRTREARDIVRLVGELVADGKTAFLIEHNMEMVSTISDTVIVMNFGAKIAEGAPADVLARADVIEAYLGRSGPAAELASE